MVLPSFLLQIEPPLRSLLEVNVGLVFWVTVVFGTVLLILWKYAWGPITDALETRENRIEESMLRAEHALEEAQKIQADNEKARRQADQEAQRILREARDEAEKLREEEMHETRMRIHETREQAQAEIEREKQRAIDELRAEVTDLAIEAAEKVLGEALDGSRHRRLVDDFIDELPRN